MKTIIFLFIFLLPFVSQAQQDTSLNTFSKRRIQGYTSPSRDGTLTIVFKNTSEEPIKVFRVDVEAIQKSGTVLNRNLVRVPVDNKVLYNYIIANTFTLQPFQTDTITVNKFKTPDQDSNISYYRIRFRDELGRKIF